MRFFQKSENVISGMLETFSRSFRTRFFSIGIYWMQDKLLIEFKVQFYRNINVKASQLLELTRLRPLELFSSLLSCRSGTNSSSGRIRMRTVKRAYFFVCKHVTLSILFVWNCEIYFSFSCVHGNTLLIESVDCVRDVGVKFVHVFIVCITVGCSLLWRCIWRSRVGQTPRCHTACRWLERFWTQCTCTSSAPLRSRPSAAALQWYPLPKARLTGFVNNCCK